MAVVPLFDSQVFILASPESGIAERLLRFYLEVLPRIYRVAFAAACLECHAREARNAAALPASDREEVSSGLDLVWESALHDGIDHILPADLLRPCSDLFQHKAFGVDYSASPVLACLEVARTGECEPVVRVSQHVVRSLQAQAEGEADGRAPLALPHRTNQCTRLERERQYRDLSELANRAATPSVNMVRRRRDRAITEARLPLDEAYQTAERPRRRAVRH